ncbi:1-(5-phosphoribosyl)-5-[(5-phosphoribosylamino)methylideneamino]imidazole-4-carboxamide isomerase [Clostridium botulinum]|uniref:1-(5-phosphoribosyl)-5-[(5- phosphoribosylamino)methylideneamino]imidazole-4- carboxamide isomerase n=1 Tax=Clostridium botulinum TaxID=1491 RepID=UPI000773C6E3|nr:1-(5-phosphoribosyl)-5-[(5-phosphoribosylamino)methylideneamino]imidazole-4-carboxamide isomerase [Clostridium botulinum]NFE94123.1 1-(5-phosphoribosyl)-5-[(5-phosphoribosylamino)methylideneamino]imidazole-4-carboxamide isomerase [Clostridium botulinum]NFL37361.1 1-(5-phosphoribosyl)-5-[(5-phosphoribosylamino)methylideneamino]imidazole-4-carboxamide isomerase [Clostridium botulinum]NFL63887.1 1-(5-phosphoribosyl)-5-[(5-phosphoribosylamino)methylideneamino]imidazole-4-carboxamide isomerase [Cl
MIILPAIDIIDGQAVRLYQGDYNKKEVVANDIFNIAKEFECLGVDYIHLVDLDGAKSGYCVNEKIILKLAQTVNVPIEVGGGIRNFETIEKLIENGISRVILGTIAIEDEDLLKKAIECYGEKISVGIDCKNGYVYGRGWLAESKLNYLDFAKNMESLGVKSIIVTDISKDGTLEGPNFDMLMKLKKLVKIDITASGGIRDIENIKELKNIDIYGAITGKAIYSGNLLLKEAIDITR